MGSFLMMQPSERHGLCESFRHSGWKDRRAKTLSALRACDASEATLERFRTCGCRAWVMMAQDGTKACYRLSLNRCRNRWCLPCAQEKRRTIQSNVARACEGRDLRFMTLTLKSSSNPLGQQLAKLRSSFRKLRQRRGFAPLITGGVYFIELTRNGKTGEWHPHLHILFEGGFIEHALLKSAWYDITGDSFVVDIRKLPNSGVAAGYISKYAGKPMSGKIINIPEAFEEAIEALQGARTFHVFGTWTELGLSKSEGDALAWVPYLPLADVIIRARSGDEDAKAILKRVQGGSSYEPMDDDDRDTS